MRTGFTAYNTRTIKHFGISEGFDTGSVSRENAETNHPVEIQDDCSFNSL
jgi:hypothetical protein